MECPHCHKEIPGKICPSCGATVPAKGHYCMECGVLFNEGMENSVDQEEGIDLENRVLCPDGTCTGIIVEGKCTECGKPYHEEPFTGH